MTNKDTTLGVTQIKTVKIYPENFILDISTT